MKLIYLVFLGLIACGGSPSGDATTATDGAASSKSETYACPMHPEVTANKPGEKCPKCGMELVKAEEHDHNSHEHKGKKGKGKKGKMKMNMKDMKDMKHDGQDGHAGH